MSPKKRAKKTQNVRGRIPLLLVGLDNPQSADPRFALYPAPKNCAGERLFRMMQMVLKDFTVRDYVAIPKTNLFPVGMTPKVNRKAMLRGAGRILLEQLRDQNTRVVVLGKEAAQAVQEAHDGEIDKCSMKTTEYYEMFGSWYAWIPHPSGRNHIYNDVKNKRMVGKFLIESLLTSQKENAR